MRAEEKNESPETESTDDSGSSKIMFASVCMAWMTALSSDEDREVTNRKEPARLVPNFREDVIGRSSESYNNAVNKTMPRGNLKERAHWIGLTNVQEVTGVWVHRYNMLRDTGLAIKRPFS